MTLSAYMKANGLTPPSYDFEARTWTLRNPDDQFEERVVPANSLPLVDSPFGQMCRWDDILEVTHG